MERLEDVIDYTRTILDHIKLINKENLISGKGDFNYEEIKTIIEKLPDKFHLEEEKEELLNGIEKIKDRLNAKI